MTTIRDRLYRGPLVAAALSSRQAASSELAGRVAQSRSSGRGGLRAAVASVRADDMGERAWAEVRTLRVEHHAGTLLSVVPVADGLAVRADLTAALPRVLGAELARMVSASL